MVVMIGSGVVAVRATIRAQALGWFSAPVTAARFRHVGGSAAWRYPARAMAIVYRMTAKGVAEIETQAHRLLPRLRSALILVDGKKSDGE